MGAQRLPQGITAGSSGKPEGRGEMSDLSVKGEGAGERGPRKEAGHAGGLPPTNVAASGWPRLTLPRVSEDGGL